MATILLVGGTGYIGSHVAHALLVEDHKVILFDNLNNSKRNVVDRIVRLANKPSTFVEGDMCKKSSLDTAFSEHQPDLVILLAGLKAVGESQAQPNMYYRTNVVGALEVLEAMKRHDCFNLVFSSSATIYGNPVSLPISEKHPVSPINPYGHTKAMIEQISADFSAAEPRFNVINLRYFNPVGAHKSGLLGEDPNGIPNNLFPYIAKVAGGQLSQLNVYGNDYDTRDGTGERDYIHVVDLAKGHLAAANALVAGHLTKVNNINLGTGTSYSVLEVLSAWSEIVGRDLPYRFVARRKGDSATSYADPTLARDLLGWKSELGLKKMCQDHWNWQTRALNYE